MSEPDIIDRIIHTCEYRIRLYEAGAERPTDWRMERMHSLHPDRVDKTRSPELTPMDVDWVMYDGVPTKTEDEIMFFERDGKIMEIDLTSILEAIRRIIEEGKDKAVREDYDSIRASHSEANLAPWEELSEEDRERLRVEYRRYTQEINDFGQQISRGEWP